MASITMLTVLLFLFITTAEGGEKKKSSDKIIIHVPYKIHKHHHTHTKYKVITIPAPKKEHTVIYLKEQIQPVIKEVPAIHTQVEITETQPDLPKTPYHTPEVIIPPHQQSAQSYLTDISDTKIGNPTPVDQHQEYSTIAADQKPLETHTGQYSQDFSSHFSYKPMTLSSHDNLIQDHPFKHAPLHPQLAVPPKFFLHPTIHHSYNNFHPKFTYQPILLPQSHFTPQYPQYTVKPLAENQKVLPDSVASHTSSQVYKTVTPGPGLISYKVKEENQEGEAMQLVKHQHIPNAIPVPLPKSKRKGKTYVHFGQNQLSHLKRLPYNHDYEYEHVGYLIIDGNSKKIVGKNLKDELHLTR